MAARLNVPAVRKRIGAGNVWFSRLRRRRSPRGRFFQGHAVPFGEPLGSRQGIRALALIVAAVREFQEIAESLLIGFGKLLGYRFSPEF